MPSGSPPISTPERIATPAAASSSAIVLRRVRVSAAATRDRPDELEHDALAQRQTVDCEVEAQVHQRGGDSEERGCPQLGGRPAA